MVYDLILLFFAYLVPLYITNATPLILHGKKAIDFGKKYNGKRILGKNKTILGALSGILVGSLVSFLFAIIFPQIFVLIPNYFLLALLLALGAILGDLFESFIKRQRGIKSGERWVLADQLDFFIGGFLLSLLVRFPETEVLVSLLIITIFMHIITNFFAFKLKLKKVPW
jgi:CDP-2,3-bis-(O-geranylgeranyl)-sn-glycerol synthase